MITHHSDLCFSALPSQMNHKCNEAPNSKRIKYMIKEALLDLRIFFFNFELAARRDFDHADHRFFKSIQTKHIC